MKKLFFMLSEDTRHVGPSFVPEGEERAVGFVEVPDEFVSRLSECEWNEMDDGEIIRSYRCSCCGSLEFETLQETIEELRRCQNN